MDFSKVKKLVIPEGEVQSITIADKVVWTKPQDKKWNVIFSDDNIKCTFSPYDYNHKVLGTFDYSKSNRFRYTFTCTTRPQTVYYGDNGKQSENNKTSGTYEITNIDSSPRNLKILYGRNPNNTSESYIILKKDNTIYLDYYSFGGTADNDGWTISLKVEQFY